MMIYLVCTGWCEPGDPWEIQGVYSDEYAAETHAQELVNTGMTDYVWYEEREVDNPHYLRTVGCR